VAVAAVRMSPPPVRAQDFAENSEGMKKDANDDGLDDDMIRVEGFDIG